MAWGEEGSLGRRWSKEETEACGGLRGRRKRKGESRRKRVGRSRERNGVRSMLSLYLRVVSWWQYFLR